VILIVLIVLHAYNMWPFPEPAFQDNFTGLGTPYAAGYDLHVEKAVDRTLAKFDEIVGFENLKVVHLNDSEDGSALDTTGHQHIGRVYGTTVSRQSSIIERSGTCR